MLSSSALSFLFLGFLLSVSGDDACVSWNKHMLDAIRVYKTSPPKASRGLAMLHAAMYDAVNGINPTHQHYLVDPTSNGAPSTGTASPIAAASASARVILSNLYPANTSDWQAIHSLTVDGIPAVLVQEGEQWGSLIANRIILERADDNSTWTLNASEIPPFGAPPAACGWRPAPPAYGNFLLPNWAYLKPFAMQSTNQFRPSGPPQCDSSVYTQNFEIVKAFGNVTSSVRTADQTEIAHFWADGAGTETPPGHWNTIAHEVTGGKSLAENCRLFALLNLAMGDAAIIAWDAKLFYHQWRPITAIREADHDGNQATSADPNWSPLVATPPFPDYISGHATFSGAACKILALFEGSDDFSFTTGSDFLPGVYRSYTSFSQAADESSASRLYGGIHFPLSNSDGVQCGKDVADYIFATILAPLEDTPRGPNIE